MFTLKLESLVRGVSVLSDGLAVGVRLGSNEVGKRTPTIPFTLRHPSLGTQLMPSFAWAPSKDHGNEPGAKARAHQAGRPAACLAGVLGCWSPAYLGRDAAMVRRTRPDSEALPTPTLTCLHLLEGKQVRSKVRASASLDPWVCATSQQTCWGRRERTLIGISRAAQLRGFESKV